MPEINQSNTPSLLKQLGFQPDQRVVIFHADDVGMCHGANLAFEKLSKDGSINCGSVMVPCPWFSEVVAMAAANPRLDLGVHLTLTSEWQHYRWAPISTTDRSSGLIDADDYVVADDDAPLGVSEAQAGAIYNFKFVLEDRSDGIHNYKYALALLTSSMVAF